MQISFVSATSEELEQAEQDPEWAEEFLDALYDFDDEDAPGRPEGDLDKAWAGLEFLLSEVETGVEWLMEGHPIDDEGSLFAWDVEQVRQTARTFRSTPWEVLATHYDPRRMMENKVYPRVWDHDPDGELEWLKDAYERITAFFNVAADEGYGALMTFSY